MRRGLALVLLIVACASCRPPPVVVVPAGPKVITFHAADTATVVCFDRPPLNNYLGLPASCLTVGELRQLVVVRLFARAEAER